MGLGLDDEAMVGMFDEEAAAKTTPVAPVVEVAPVVFVDMAIPKSWSGKTPKTLLLDWNRYKKEKKKKKEIMKNKKRKDKRRMEN